MAKKKKIWGFIDSQPMIWFHYIPLVAAAFAGFYIVNSFGLPAEVGLVGLFSEQGVKLFAFYVIWLGFWDQVIHKVLGVD